MSQFPPFSFANRSSVTIQHKMSDPEPSPETCMAVPRIALDEGVAIDGERPDVHRCPQ